MDLKLKIVNPLDYPDWDNILTLNKNLSFFYSLVWAKILVESYRYKPVYFKLYDNNELLALIPFMEISSFLTGRRGVSLPFSDYCEPIISNKIPFQDVLNFILHYGNKAGWKFFELRGGGELYQDIPPSRFYYIHTLDLTQNEKQIFSNFRSSTARNIKKSIREGIEITKCNSIESVKEFYRLNSMTRKCHGLPPQQFRFFKKIYEHIISQKKGFVILASHLKKTIAGAIFFHYGDNAMFKYGASDKTYQHLRANNLVIWEAIKWYTQNEFKSFSFGRTDPGNLGLLQFKRGWGVKEEIIRYCKYDFKRGIFIKDHCKYNVFHRIIEKTPISISHFIGFLLYRHFG